MLNVPPGKSISFADVQEVSKNKETTIKSSGIKKKQDTTQSSSKITRSEYSDEGRNSLTVLPNTNNNLQSNSTDATFKVGDFVVVNFEGNLFPEKVTDVRHER